jgi:predicted nucleotidyltransferase
MRFRGHMHEFHVASLDLFGSYAHGEQTPESDVGLLVSFSQLVSASLRGRLLLYLAHQWMDPG